MKPTTQRNNKPIAVLDIGTSKVVCMIGHFSEDGRLEITGVGHQLAKGIKSAVIMDINEAATSVSAAVHAAEQMAGEMVEEVVLSVNGANVKSRNVSVELDILNDGVSDQDIADIIHEGTLSLMDDESTIIHCFPSFYTLDGARGIRDPRGMVGKKLGAELQIITAKNLYLHNLAQCVASAHLNISEYVMASHAAALSVLAPDEKDLGATFVEMGAGVTSVSVFVGGRNVFSNAIAVGGNHITSDIAQGLSTSLHHAERLKTLQGSAVVSNKDAEVMVEVPQLGEGEDDDEVTQMPRSMLIGVVRPRVEEVLELVKTKLEASGADKITGRRCVLSGGASQMLGVSDLASRMLSKQVRRGKPMGIIGLADAASGPAFATAIGMFHYVHKRAWEEQILMNQQSRRRFLPERLVNWFKENF